MCYVLKVNQQITKQQQKEGVEQQSDVTNQSLMSFEVIESYKGTRGTPGPSPGSIEISPGTMFMNGSI